MVPYLLPNFLDDPEEYRQAESLWNDQWQKLIREVGQDHLWTTPWIRTAFADGTPWMDGNPIFSAVCPSSGRGIRVIQQEPSGEAKELNFWTDTFAQGEGEEVKELVISCTLTDATLQEAVDLIRQWITQPGGQPGPQSQAATSPAHRPAGRG